MDFINDSRRHADVLRRLVEVIEAIEAVIAVEAITAIEAQGRAGFITRWLTLKEEKVGCKKGVSRRWLLEFTQRNRGILLSADYG